VTRSIANVDTNLIFAFCAVASVLLVLGRICVQISLCPSVNVDGLTSRSIRNAEWLGCTAAVLQIKARKGVLQFGYFKLLNLSAYTYTDCNSHFMYYEHEHKQSGHIGRYNILQRSSQQLLATFGLLAMVTVTISVWTYIHLLHTATNPTLTFTILSVADLFREYDRTWFRFRLPTALYLNTLNAELNPICHLLAFFGAHPIFHVSRIRVKFPHEFSFTATRFT
jgi:hypothetical protein